MQACAALPSSKRPLAAHRPVRVTAWLMVLATQFGSIALAGETGGASPARPAWTTSRIAGRPEPPPPYRVEPVFGGLSFKQPVDLARAPGSDRLFVLELEGRIYSFPAAGEPAEADLFLDLAAEGIGAHRAYGLEFAPNFAASREVYVCYVLPGQQPDGTRVSRFRVPVGDPPCADPASEEVLVTWLSGGHNGGCLKFGPDGYLYISTGDGTGPFPPDIHNTGQDIGDLLSSVLRIDVATRDDRRPYAIPADNPFVELAGARPEVWAYGFRNPWKMSFDPADGALWVGDVGWELWELVYRVQRGGNYGWSVMEGRQPVRPESPRGPTPILPPTVDHPHTEARSVTGGCVYRGSRLSELQGAYVYGDYVTGRIWGLRHDGSQVTWHRELAASGLQIITFGEDHSGELYVVDYAGGFYRLVPNAVDGAATRFPRRLSETGLFVDAASQRPAVGVVPYRINAEPWADGVMAQRWIGLPGDSSIEVQRQLWQFPAGTVLAKTLALPQGNAAARRVETQLLHFDGVEWLGYSYAWNDDQTDALLVDAAGRQAAIELAADSAEGQPQRASWTFASRAECAVCHNPRAGSVLGFIPAQLARPAHASGDAHDFLGELGRLGMLVPGQPRARQLVTAMVDPYDEQAPLDARARSYLHVNCAHCHRRGGGGNSALELPYELPLDRTNSLGVRPALGTFGIAGGEVIAPGDPCGSVLLYRISTIGGGRMPRAGAASFDAAGVRLIRRWIAQLPAAPVDSGGPSRRDSGSPPADLAQALRTTRGAMAVLESIDEGRMPAAVADQAAVLAAAEGPAEIRGLFERFLPEEQRVRVLGNVVDPAAILVLTGDAERGRRLFAEAAAAQCKSCHKVGDVGQALGPDLTTIGRKLAKPALLEAILDPSKTIEPKFVPYTVETRGGQVHVGLVESRNAGEIVLRDAQNKQIRISADEIEVAVPQQRSLMPDLLVRDLTAQDVADLLEYLAGLR